MWATKREGVLPDTLRREALAMLHDVGVAPVSVAYGLARADGRTGVAWSAFVGDAAILGGFGAPGAEVDGVCLADVRARTTFGDAGGPEPGPGWRARRLVFDGARFVASIGVARACAPFTLSELARLRPTARDVAERLIAADRVERAQTPVEPGEQLYDTDGRLALATAPGAAWSSVPGFADAAGALVAELHRRGGPEAHALWRTAGLRARRMEGTAGVHYLVRVTPSVALQLSPAALLSPRQREVCDYAAAGATVAQIADATGITAETVRSNLREAYRRLGVASRVELAEAMRGGQ